MPPSPATPPSRRVVVEPELVVTGGERIAAYRFGGDGPPLLLVHATGFHAHCWLPLLDHLRPCFSLFAFDLPGHGESSTPADPARYHFTRMADDLLAVLDHFGLPRVAALGHSVGGALVVRAELLRPGTVTRAVLFEPIILPPEQQEETRAAEAARTRRMVFDSTADMIARWSTRGPFATFDPAALEAYVEYGVRDRADGTVELKCSRPAEVATFMQDTTSGIWNDLERYATPAMIYAGERSTSRAAPLVERIAARMRDARAERLATFSHFLPFERPRAMAERAIAFLT
ncbi:MAG: alpha/beta hydrolase [Candidatus Rokubacteria bacterium]|nr:alpha/beta hydrolase [Candidatus Rokubacteria bacterium]